MDLTPSLTPNLSEREFPGNTQKQFLLPLILAILLVPVSNGRWAIPIAAWLAPLFLLYLVRTQKPFRGLLIVYFLFLVAFPVQWTGLVPLEGIDFWLFGIGLQFGFLIPYLLDRVVGPRIPGFASTLVFPLAWTSIEYIVAQTSPYATWGSVAYTQYGNSSLIQLLSVTGLSGVTFLVSWFGSIVSWAWIHSALRTRVHHSILVYGAVLGLVLLVGGARMEFLPSNSETVRIASLTIDTEEAKSIWKVRREGISPASINDARQKTRLLHDTLFTRTEEVARSGNQIVFWSELNGLVLKDDETRLITRGKEIARKHRIYLAMTLGTFTPGQRLMENKLVVIDSNGEVATIYFKGRPVPGDPETGASETIPTIETPFGKIAFAICYDLDFPGFIRHAGQSQADIMLVPALDPPGIDPIHTRMAIFRAIENGCALIRQADHGLSIATDHRGRILASMDYFSTKDRVLLSHVPTRGTSTIYASIGDMFAWLCITGLGLLTVCSFLRVPREDLTKVASRINVDKREGRGIVS